MSKIEKECKHYDDYFSQLQTCNINTTDCDAIDDCYYKQLQQLKQKLEKIKEKCISINNILNGVSDSDYNCGRVVTAQQILKIINVGDEE